MLLLILEALAAFGLLIFIVWWVMFAGRRKGEREDADPPA
jgi:cbb3-type cytochrome oxidase subunit 3